jgi:hypothetical protein
VSAVLLPPMTRLSIAMTGLTGPAHVRERLQQAEAGELGTDEAVWLGNELYTLAALLAG